MLFSSVIRPITHSVAPVINKRSVSIALATTLTLGLVSQSASAASILGVLNALSPRGDVAVSKNLAYGDQPLQNMDIYYPKALASRIKQAQTNHAKNATTLAHTYPMVVFVHGGSWKDGNKDQYAFMGESLAQAGYVTAVINYRKAPKHRYPDFVEDTAQGIAWAYHHSRQYGGDPNRFAVMGHSAGAFNVVAAVADQKFLQPYDMAPDDIRAVIGIAGPYSYDFNKYPDPPAFPAGADPDVIMPDHHITGTQPPYFLLTAQNDDTVDPINTQRMLRALNAKGVATSTAVIKHADHGSSIGAFATPLRWVNQARTQVLAYLNAHVATPDIHYQTALPTAVAPNTATHLPAPVTTDQADISNKNQTAQ